MNTVLTRGLLDVIPGRAHTAFKTMRLNSLWNWDISNTCKWIEKKRKQFMMFRGAMRRFRRVAVVTLIVTTKMDQVSLDKTVKILLL